MCCSPPTNIPSYRSASLLVLLEAPYCLRGLRDFLVTTNRQNQCSAQNMKLAINYAIAAIFLLLSFAAPVIAGPLEDGIAALGRGEYAAAEIFLRPLADHGDAKAQYFLGTMYMEGHEVPRRRVVAARSEE